MEILSIVGERLRLKMDRGDFDWEESSRAGRSRTFDGLEDIVDDMGESASKPHGKKKAALKKVAGVKKPSATTKKRVRRESGSSEAVLNPDEPVRDSWIGVKPKEFRRDRLQFNPYAFGRSTSDDPRFYCKMHEQIFEQRLERTKNSFVKWDRSEERRVGKECRL